MRNEAPCKVKGCTFYSATAHWPCHRSHCTTDGYCGTTKCHAFEPDVMIDFTGVELFVVRNRSGMFFRAKGYSGSGATWVKDIKSARIYTKIGPARAQVSYFANNYPEYGAPEILKLTIGGYEVLDETARVEKQKKTRDERIAIEEKKAAMRRVADAAQALDEAQKRYADVTKAVSE